MSKRPAKDSSKEIAGIAETADDHPAAKRPAPEAPPEKAATTTDNHNDPIDTSSITSFYKLNGPLCAHDNVFRQVSFSEIDNIAKACYSQVLAVIYPDGLFDTRTLISETDFVNVCRYGFKQRIDHVYSTLTGRRPEGRAPLSRAALWPKAIADCINQYGSKIIHLNSTMVIPQPPPNPEDTTQRLNNLVTYTMLTSFSRFVTLAQQRHCIRIASLSAVPEGTSAWLLTCRSASERLTVANNDTTHVQIWSQFGEFTPGDAIFAGLLSNGFNGQILNGCLDLYFCTDAIVDVNALRVQYSTLA